MKKKHYEKPSVEVVELQTSAVMIEGSAKTTPADKNGYSGDDPSHDLDWN